MNNDNIYPNCPIITRDVEVGGLTKTQLVNRMRQQSIRVNKFGEILLTDDRFTTSAHKYTMKTVELTVHNLGLPEGGTMIQIYHRADELGLALCPLEVGPFLRLAYLDQPEGYSNNHQHNQAPNGSITVASEIMVEDDDFPKGFYLRRIDGELWLRGYVCDDQHMWNPCDHFIFVNG